MPVTCFKVVNFLAASAFLGGCFSEKKYHGQSAPTNSTAKMPSHVADRPAYSSKSVNLSGPNQGLEVVKEVDQPHAVKSIGSTIFRYDGNGNLVSTNTGRRLSWDAYNRPLEADGIVYTYAPDGTRRSKVAANGTVTLYPFGDNYEVRLPSGQGVETQGIYVSMGKGYGQPLAKIVGNKKTWHHVDYKASIRAMTDEQGKVVARKSYQPFGDQHRFTGAVESKGFTGERQDENGLMYLHARYYDPKIGRFISPDPTIPNADLVGLNRYAYALNDPVNNDDRDGLKGKPRTQQKIKPAGTTSPRANRGNSGRPMAAQQKNQEQARKAAPRTTKKEGWGKWAKRNWNEFIQARWAEIRGWNAKNAKSRRERINQKGVFGTSLRLAEQEKTRAMFEELGSPTGKVTTSDMAQYRNNQVTDVAGHAVEGSGRVVSVIPGAATGIAVGKGISSSSVSEAAGQAVNFAVSKGVGKVSNVGGRFADGVVGRENSISGDATKFFIGQGMREVMNINSQPITDTDFAGPLTGN